MLGALVHVVLVGVVLGTSKNMRAFWAKALGQSSLAYDAEAGFEAVDWYFPKGQAKLFYQLYSVTGGSLSSPAPQTPLVLWLQGGPAYSSMFGSFAEIGPIEIAEGKPKVRSPAWNDVSHLLLLDQPLNVGFSSNTAKGEVSGSDEAARHVLNFLANFYNSWPALRQSPLYLAGESYAGHYIPAIARAMLIANKTFLSDQRITLAGILLNDAWIDPMNQMNYFDSTLYSVGVTSNKFRDICSWFQTNSILSLEANDLRAATAYYDFITHNDTTTDYYLGGMKLFNFRRYSSYDQTYVDFIQKNKEAFGVDSSMKFVVYNAAVREAFTMDIMRSYGGYISQILGSTRVLIYNGQQDVLINHAGVMQYLNSLRWSGISNWKQSRKSVWRIYGEVRGWAKTSGNLWFATLYGAGHTAPRDQPIATLNLLTHFFSNNRNWNQ